MIGNGFNEAMQILEGSKIFLYAVLGLCGVGFLTGVGIPGRFQEYIDRETGESKMIEHDWKNPETLRYQDGVGKFRYFDKK